MEGLETQYGTLTGISNFMTYADGALKSCMLNAENRIATPVGDIVPQYRMAEFGERQKKHRSSLSFYPGGQLKSASLDRAMPLRTPLGEFKAEFVTFYEDGSLNRLFPLNGQIDGFWSEKMEGELAEVLDFDLPVGSFRAKIISLHFYPGGALKSLTLWPGQRVTIETPVGPMRIRTGFSLYEDGSVRSVEPSGPFELATPIGLVKAFDAEVMGMNADQNSVQFSPEGTLLSVKTVHTGIRAIGADQVEKLIEPLETTSLIEMTSMRTVPMQIDFAGSAVRVVAAQEHAFDLTAHTLETFERARVIRESCGSCAGCDGGESCCQNG
ncbi:MAG: hypothetical protein Q7Q73_11475 [Verrucomicrobiota bacterium JB024]|nr:hypothetical protein [Verrucomicrobiota bacterium JB024]